MAEEAKVRATGAVKNDLGKLRFDLIPTSADRALARVLTHGATKYADRNWENGFPWMDILSALKRHLDAWTDGMDLDEDHYNEKGELIKGSGLNHLEHVICNTAFLLEFLITHPELDNRPKKTREQLEEIYNLVKKVSPPLRVFKDVTEESDRYGSVTHEEMLTRNINTKY